MKKLDVIGVIKEGLGIGLKNAASLIGALILYIVTIWIPYINVGTTIAICSIPIELAKGNVISPTFIFDKKYRKYMGEFFTLIGLMSIALIPAFAFLIVPAIVIGIGWSLAIYILIDKEVSPADALTMSTKATYGNKWAIFFISLILVIAFYILFFLFVLIPYLGVVLIIALAICYSVVTLGCRAVIYRDLAKDAPLAEK